jgi:predicted nucleotidyltransferase component of viral defense system
MLFDPKKRETLSPDWRAVIAHVMQIGLIDEIFDADVWTPEDIVFQGGTSIHVVWGSPRYSEDLDFMVSVDRSRDIERVMARAVRNIGQRMLLSLPGGQLAMKSPKADSGAEGEVLAYQVVWSHPSKQGVVKVKTEFFTVAPERIRDYKREVRRHSPDLRAVASRPEFSGFDVSDLRVRSMIPAAHPESIYGDKLVAMAKRQYVKQRDFFDLWWLATQMGGAVDLTDPAQLYEAVRRSAACYRYSDEEIAEGMNLFLETPAEAADEIEENLKAFLPPQFHRRLASTGAFQEMYTHAMEEGSRLLMTIEARYEGGARP